MEWHYGLADTPHGPISDEQLLELVRKGTVRPDTLVWTEYLVDWVPAEEVEGLFLAAGVAEPALTADETDSPWAEKPQLINAAPKADVDPVPASQAFARIWEKPALTRPKDSTAAFTPQERRPESPRTNALADRPRTGTATGHTSGEIGQRPQPEPVPPTTSTVETPETPTDPEPPASPSADPDTGLIPSPFSQNDTEGSADTHQSGKPQSLSQPSADQPNFPDLNPFTTPPPGAAPEPTGNLPSPEQPPATSEAPADQPKLPDLNPFTTPPPGAAPEPTGNLPSPQQPPATSEAPADQPKLPELNPFTTPPPGAAPEPTGNLPSPQQPPATSEAPADQPKLPDLNPFTTPPPGAAPEPTGNLPSPQQPPATSEAPADQPKLPELNPFTKSPPGATPEPTAELEPSEPSEKVEPAAHPDNGINPFTQAPPPSTAELEKVAAEAKKAQEIERAENAAKKAKLPRKKSVAAPKPLADAPKGTSKSAFTPAPAPTSAPASVQREKSGVTAPLENSGSSETVDGKKNPEASTEGSSKNWKRPESSPTKRRSSFVPFLVKSALVLALSAGSAFGLHSYRSHLAAQVPEEPPPPPPVVTPPPVVEKSLAYLVASLGRTDFQNILFWQIEESDDLPSWLEEATPLPLLDNLRSPTELPEWVFSSSPETVLVAQFPVDPSPGSEPLSPLIIIRVPKDVAAGLPTYFPPSSAVPLTGGAELIPASPAANSAGTAGVYLDKRTLAIAPEATIRALFDHEKPTKPNSAVLGLVESFKDSAPVIVADRQALPDTDVTTPPHGLPPASQIWEATLYSADEKGFVLEQATISIGGPPPVGSHPPAPVPHPDLLLGRVLLGSEIEQVKNALRTTKPRFPDGRLAVLPKELFLDQNDTPAPGTVAPQPYRYLPDFYRAVVTHDLKKLRENPRFNEFRMGAVNRPHYWRELDQINYGLLARDLDQIHTCASELGNCHVLVARFPLTVEHFGKSVDPLGGYTVKGLQLYPVQPRSSTETLYLCIIEERIAVIAPGAMLNRIIRQAGEPSPLQPYMEELYPIASEFEESLFLRVEGRTGDVRYHGVQALFFGENYDPDGYDSRRVIKCRNASMAEEFNRLMHRRREDAADEKVGTSVADLLSVGMDEGNLVIGAKIPDDLWETYTTYFKNVILPEG